MGKLDIYSGNVEIRELIDPRQNVPNAGKDIIGLINANCQVRIRESKRRKHLQLRSKGAPIQEQSKNSDLSGKQLCAGQFSASQSIHATHGSAGIGLINGEEVNIQLPGEVYLIPTQLRGPLPKDTVGLLLLRSHAQKKRHFCYPGDYRLGFYWYYKGSSMDIFTPQNKFQDYLYPNWFYSFMLL